MGSWHEQQRLDVPDRKTTHHDSRELSEQELIAVSGGDGPPGTAGDGNGRVYWHNVLR